MAAKSGAAEKNVTRNFFVSGKMGAAISRLFNLWAVTLLQKYLNEDNLLATTTNLD